MRYGSVPAPGLGGVVNDVAGQQDVARWRQRPRNPCLFKALVADLRRRVERGAIPAVMGSTPTKTAETGACPMNVPLPQPGSRNPAAAEPSVDERLPHHRRDRRIGVVGVEDRGFARWYSSRVSKSASSARSAPKRSSRLSKLPGTAPQPDQAKGGMLFVALAGRPCLLQSGEQFQGRDVG